jgi:hypothetical protein
LIGSLVTAMLASSLLAAAAEARGGGHMEGLGNSHIGIRSNAGPSGSPLHHRAMDQSWSGYTTHSDDHSCYYPEEAPKYPPWPPFCS